MSDNKKYYWLKLQKTFFSDVKVKMLRKIAGGDTYTIIYLKLLLETIDNNGEFLPEGITDDPIQEIAMTIDETEEDVKVCVGLLEKLKLCEVTDNSILFYEALANTGKETSSARRVREHRTKMLQCNNDVTNCNTELEIDIELKKEKEIDIELKKEKEIDIDLEKPKKEVKHKYGEHNNILLTDQELEKLKEQFEDWQEKIENISEGVAMKGYKYKSHYLAILKWAKNENKKATEKKSSWKEREDALLGDWG